ncbi:MAG TPA: hypothetical protein VK106_01755 [Balneolaceae bacterium]|nr:hypothetical protein [Balneolaceae bacterium]
MLKKAVSILVLLSVLATMMQFTLPYLWYYSNYDYIVNELCENRDNPGMHCNGTCQLKKMIHKEHKHNEQKPVPPTSQKHKIDLFVVLNEPTAELTPISFSSIHYLSQIHSIWFFKPPVPPPRIS